MVDNLFFDTKSEESDTPIQTDPSEKSNEPFNLSESKFKPITTNRLTNPVQNRRSGKFLEINDNITPNANGIPPQPWLVPPILPPPFPSGMGSALPMMSMPTSQLNAPSHMMPPPDMPLPPNPPIPPFEPLSFLAGGWKKGCIPGWGKSGENKENHNSPPKPQLPFFPMPMLPPGPFPPPGLSMPPNFTNLPFPPPFLNAQLFPFPPLYDITSTHHHMQITQFLHEKGNDLLSGTRDLKKIGKRWGRSKRAKGKVDIDKATGRKLITAITCVACFKAKKKCIYADQNAKRCNYCLNRGINCVKRIDRRCQKVWHESGRRARLYAKAVGSDEDMLEMKDKSEDLGQLKNEDLSNNSDKNNEPEIGASDDDLLLGLPEPSRRFFRDSKNPLWMLVAENANNSNAQVG